MKCHLKRTAWKTNLILQYKVFTVKKNLILTCNLVLILTFPPPAIYVLKNQAGIYAIAKCRKEMMLSFNIEMESMVQVI